MKQDNKREYIAPVIKVTLIELEEAIAGGSANVKTGDINGEVQEEWEVGPDDTRTYNW